MKRFLSIETCCQSLSPSLMTYLPHAWHFLNLTGLINFGCNLPYLKESLASSSSTSPSVPDEGLGAKTVIIIGAGLSGAAAASQLNRWGYNVVVLEGRDRPGGRVFTARLDSRNHPEHSAVADVGGAVVSGIEGNPLAVLCHQLDVKMQTISGKAPLTVEGLAKGKTVKDIDMKVDYLHNRLQDEMVAHSKKLGPVSGIISVGSAFDALWRDGEDWEKRYNEYKSKRAKDNEESSDQESSEGEEEAKGEEITKPSERLKIARQLQHWKCAHDEFAAAATLRSISTTGWNIDDKFEFLGDHVFLPGGNIRLVQGLLEDVPVLYRAEVKKIEHSLDGVLVTTGDRTFKADACIVTVPLGVLKKGCISFYPSLPTEKQLSIRKLGFGVLNKLCLLFPRAFWNDKDDQFVFAVDDPTGAARGQFYYFFQYAGLSGGAVLAALVAGDAAIKFESDPKEESLARVMAVLRQIWEPKIGKGKVPDPIQAACSRWASDPFSYGSYSSAALGSGAADFEELAKPVNKLFFAGEATTSKWPATMHGAFLTGMREASRVARALGGNSLLLDLKVASIPLDGGLLEETSEMEDQDDTSSDSMLTSDDEDTEVEDKGDGELLLKLARDLKDLVENQKEADLMFGSFSVYFPPTTVLSSPPAEAPPSDAAGPSHVTRSTVSNSSDGTLPVAAGNEDEVLCLVRVDFGDLVASAEEHGGGEESSIPVFLAISRSDVYSLQDLKSDKERLQVMKNPHGLGIRLDKRTGSLSEAAMMRARAVLRKGRTVKTTRPALLRVLLDLIQSSPDQSPSAPEREGDVP